MTNKFTTKHKNILPSETNYQTLYQPFCTKGQNIWLLIWILKQHRCDVYLNQIILSLPFSITRIFMNFGKSYELSDLIVKKNDLNHGYCKKIAPIGTDSLVIVDSRWFNGIEIFYNVGVHPILAYRRFPYILAVNNV